MGDATRWLPLVFVTTLGCELVLGYEEATLRQEFPFGSLNASCADLQAACPQAGCCSDPAVKPGVPQDGDYRLDAYEVTVGRFRAFVDAYDGTPPPPGAGAHPFLNGTGWDASWDAQLPGSREQLIEDVTGGDCTFGKDDLLPMNCVSWYEAFAFCAWDGKRLATEAEWSWAAGGSSGEPYPWGTEPPDADRAVYGSGSLAEVGTKPAGASRFGHYDLAGNLWEWSLEPEGSQRVIRGGAFDSAADVLDRTLPASRAVRSAARATYVGFRCARSS